MELKQIQYFVTLCASKNMTLAARELFITQQALSKAVISLERELGLSLFIRNAKGMELTREGKELLPMAKKILQDGDRFLLCARELREGSGAMVRMGYVVGSFNEQSALPFSVISRYEAQNPGVSVYIEEHHRAELIQMILDEELDLAYVVEPEPQKICREDIAYRRLARECFGVLFSSDNPLSRKEDLALEDFKGETVLIGKIDPVPEDVATLSAAFETLGFKPQVAYINGSSKQCVEHVRINRGIIFSGQAYLRGLNLNRLVIRPFPDKTVLNSHVLLWKKGRKLPGHVRRALDFFKENACRLEDFR